MMQNNRSASTSRVKPTSSTDRLSKPVSTTSKASVRAPTKGPMGTAKHSSNDASCQRSTTGAFTMIAPDPQKRANILRNARAEADALNKFKQRNSMGSVHEVNRLGGTRTKANVNQARENFLQKYESSNDINKI